MNNERTVLGFFNLLYPHQALCNVCREEDSARQVKAGCGHLIHICRECEVEVNHVRHSECRGCILSRYAKTDRWGSKTLRTPEEILQQESTLVDEYQDRWEFDMEDEYYSSHEPDYNDPDDADYDDISDLPDPRPMEEY